MRKLVAVAVVLGGLIALALATTQLSSLAYGLSSLRFDDPASILIVAMSALPLIGAVLLGVYLIHNRHYLAAKWFADEEAPVVASPGLVRVGVLLLGLWLVIDSVLGTVNTLAMVVQGISAEAQMGAGDGAILLSDPWWYLIRLVRPAVELALGLILIRRSSRVTAWLWSDAPKEPQHPSLLPLCPGCGATFDPADYRADVDAIACETCGERLELPRT